MLDGETEHNPIDLAEAIGRTVGGRWSVGIERRSTVYLWHQCASDFAALALGDIPVASRFKKVYESVGLCRH